ncbi:MAG: polymer-forming cytoskeletal protein [Prevotella sp.]|jgi:cytoskeletal protein CcmA (bactofilin family)|nr:polymer-forming cytoskeletal protein [Prevotella sp.]
MAKNKDAISANSGTHNVLASGTKLIGEITSEEDFRVDGIIEGNIFCKGKIIVGPTSTIIGNIECTNIELLGNVTGNILCSNTVVLRASCIISGDLKTEVIEIEPGAKFEGKCSTYYQQKQLEPQME